MTPAPVQDWGAVIESLDDALLTVDAALALTFANEAASELFGHSRTLTPGTPLATIVHPDAWILDLVEATHTGGLRRARREDTLHRRGRDPLAILASASVLRDSAHRPNGAVVLLQDVSPLRELGGRAAELTRLSHLETLVAGLAHEIKNPLSGMRGAAQLLADRTEPGPRLNECSRIIIDEIDRLNGLLGQLLDLSGPPRLDVEAVNIHEILDRVLAIESTGPRPDLRVRRAFDPSLPAVPGDPARLTQLLLNLIRNAIEASPERGEIAVTTRLETSYRSSARSRGRHLAIEVTDQGPGVGAQDVDRIFEPFFTTKRTGTGLGLAVARRIVADHGGSLRVRPAQPHGSVFVVTLPLERNADDF